MRGNDIERSFYLRDFVCKQQAPQQARVIGPALLPPNNATSDHQTSAAAINQGGFKSSHGESAPY
jgi:hypothetical protein